MDVHNTSDKELKRKMLFLNETTVKETEKLSRCCIISTMICNYSVLMK